MSSVNGFCVQNEDKGESKIENKFKLWRLRESELKEEFAERIKTNVMVKKIGVV